MAACQAPPARLSSPAKAVVPGTSGPAPPFVQRGAAGISARPSFPYESTSAVPPFVQRGVAGISSRPKKFSSDTGMRDGARAQARLREPDNRCEHPGSKMRRRRATGGAVDLPGLWTPGRRRRRIRGTSASWPARVRHGRSAFAADGNASRCQHRAVRSLSPNRQRLPTILFSRNRRTCASVTNPSSRRETGNLTRLPPGPSNSPPISPSPTGHNNLFDQLVGDRIQFSTIPSATSRNLFFFPSSSSSLNFSRCSLIALSNSPRTFFPAGAF